MRTMLLVLLSCLWLSASALEHKQHGTLSLRRRRSEAKNVIYSNRQLNEFVPSFSKNDKSLVETKMPQVTLLLRGLDGTPLGDKSYAALQTSMNDYLQKRFEGYFEPKYDFRDAKSEVISDTSYEGENAIVMETTLSFRDPTYVQSEYELDDLGVGKRQRIAGQPSFRASAVYATQAPEPTGRIATEFFPSELELEIAAGHAFNDLSSLYNHVLVAATIENLSTFNGMTKIESLEEFPTTLPAGQEIEVAEKEEEKPSNPGRGQIQAPSSGGLNVAAASSALKQSGTDRLNPLWPALIVGMGVFLFTIIILGYRKHRSRQRDFEGAKYNEHSENVMIHIRKDSSTLEGDEEIEVEDTLYSSSPENSPDRKQRRKQKERQLDKEYANSCLKPVGIAGSPATSAASDDEDDMNSHEQQSRSSCLKIPFRRRGKRSLGEQDSMAYSIDISEYPRRVDLTTEPETNASWRNPAQVDDAGEGYDNGDMSKKERKRFAKYIQSGLTIEEASSQIMNERKRKNENLPAPSSLTQTRSGTVGGYTSAHRGQYHEEEEPVQSSPMGCFDANVCGDEVVETEVNYGQNENVMSLGEACSANDPNLLAGLNTTKEGRNIEGTARAMVITEASSYASSYDDDEFDRAMAEAEAEVHYI